MPETLRILLVEDNPGDTDLIREQLPETGPIPFKIESVTRLELAIEVLSDKCFDLVLLDLGLPDSSGLDTFIKLHRKFPDVSIIVLSGNTDEETAIQAVKSGAQDYLVKGHVVGNQLERATRYAIERKRSQMLLLERERRLREAQRLGRIGDWEFDLSDNSLFWSEMVFEIHQRDLELGPPSVEEEAEYYSKSDVEILRNNRIKSIETGESYETDIQILLPDGKMIDAMSTGTPVRNSEGRTTKIIGTIQDITRRKQLERQQVLTTNILKWLNAEEDPSAAIYEVLQMIKGFAKVESAAIRIKGDNDFPYITTNGLSTGFIEAEKSLLTYDSAGNLLKDPTGVPLLDCMCGKVISGLTDPDQPHFTSRGSFWTNSVTALLDSIPGSELPQYERLARNGSDFESVALIPLLANNEIIGLLQLNDTKPDRYSTDIIKYLEDLGAILGIALSKIQASIQLKTKTEQLHLSEERFRLAMLGANDGLWDWDLQTDEVYFSPRWKSMLGYEEHEIMSHIDELVRLLHPEDISTYLAASHSYIQGDCDRYELEYRVRHKQGQYLTILTRGTMVKDDDGKPLRFTGTHQDVSAKKQNEKALREAANKWQSTFDAISDIVCIVSPEHDILEINRAGIEAIGAAKDQIIGRKSYELLFGQSKPTDFYSGDELLDSSSPIISEYEIGEHCFSLCAWPIKGEGNSTAGLVHIIRDVTENRRAKKKLEEKELQLQQSQKVEAIGRLAGGIAHDFNNLLTVIINNSQLALKDVDPKDPLHSDIADIALAGEKAAVLTGQLLAFSRKQILTPQVLNLNRVLQEIEKMLIRVIGEDIDMVTILSPDLGSVKADRGQIEQVIMNLAVNARDAMPEGGKLTLETSNVILDEEYAAQHIAVKPGKYVMLAVSDNGTGMSEETKTRLFDPFYTTKEAGKGTGLGLSTVYGIVKQSDGNIWVYSEPGRGTTFKFYLPLVKEAETEIADGPHRARFLRGNETILVLEDESSVRKMVSKILKSNGYRVLEAALGGEALLICERFSKNIDLLITDVIMPQMNGREAAERLTKERPGLKVLFMSGYTDNAILHHGVLDDGVSFLQKPFTVNDLLIKVRKLLDNDQKPQS